MQCNENWANSLVPNAPKIFLEKGKSTSVGKHGYNPRKTPGNGKLFFMLGEMLSRIILKLVSFLT